MGEQEKKHADEEPANFWQWGFPTFRYILRLPTKRWFIYCVCIFMILLCIDLTLAWWWRQIPVSYQTTHILGPLNTDGTVDYVAALNAQYGKNVTPDNNALVAILQATGTDYINKRALPKYLQLLGMTTFLQPSKPFQSYDDYFNVKPAAVDQNYEHLTSVPFTNNQYPQVAEWLKSQHAARDWYLMASEKPYWYEPMVSSSQSFRVISILLPSLGRLRQLTELLQIDAMERLGQNDVSGAWSDALAIHRMARLEIKTPFAICQLVAIGLEASAGYIDQQIVAYGHLTSDQADDMLQDLQSLQEFSNYPGSIEGERYAILDFFQSVARGHSDLEMTGIGPNMPPIILYILPIHYAVGMSDINQRYDDIDKVFMFDTYAKAKALLDSLSPLPPIHGGLLTGNWFKFWLEALMPTFSRFVERYYTGLAIMPLTQTEFALAAWHADHADYPKTLAELVPQHLTNMPIDPFDGQPLRYQQANGGYKLWSIGFTQINPTPNYVGDLEFTITHYDLQFTMPPAQQN